MKHLHKEIWAASWQNQQNGCAPGEDSDQTLSGCPGWSESSLGAKSICWFCHEPAHFISAKVGFIQRSFHLRWLLTKNYTTSVQTRNSTALIIPISLSRATEVAFGCHQGCLWAHAPLTLAGSHLMTRSVIWSLVPGRMMVVC